MIPAGLGQQVGAVHHEGGAHAVRDGIDVVIVGAKTPCCIDEVGLVPVGVVVDEVGQVIQSALVGPCGGVVPLVHKDVGGAAGGDGGQDNVHGLGTGDLNGDVVGVFGVELFRPAQKTLVHAGFLTVLGLQVPDGDGGGLCAACCGGGRGCAAAIGRGRGRGCAAARCQGQRQGSGCEGCDESFHSGSPSLFVFFRQTRTRSVCLSLISLYPLPAAISINNTFLARHKIRPRILDVSTAF